MRYLFASERRDYSDYASGHVFMGRPGHPAFPLRLASELFQRCLAVRRAEGLSGPCVLYDPCCGGAYLLSTLAYLHWHEIDQVIGSDIDEEALALAARNLSLLRLEGLDRRIEDLAAMRAAYGKASHAAALERAGVLRQRLAALNETHRVAAHLFCADATDGQALRDQLLDQRIDVVLTDVPYDRQATSQGAADDPGRHLLEALKPVLAPGAVVALASDKRQKIAHESYERLERLRLGKRQVVLLKPRA